MANWLLLWICSGPHCSNLRPQLLDFFQHRLHRLIARNSGLWIVGIAIDEISILKKEKAEVVVVKRDIRGSIVVTQDKITEVSAYETPNVWSIGSGDIFSALFSAHWGVNSLPPHEAAVLASKGTAYYCSNQVLPIPETLPNYSPVLSVPTTNQQIYLAGPYFTLAQRWMVNEARNILTKFGVNVFSPFHDIGYGHYNDIARKDLEAVDASSLVLAILDAYDPGTVFEIAHARSNNIPVVCYYQGTDFNSLTMFKGTGCDVISDFSTAIYKTCWKLSAK